MAMDDRRIERKENGVWQVVAFESLKAGDTFRMFESDGDPVDGGMEFEAVRDAYKDTHGVWGVPTRRCRMIKESMEDEMDEWDWC